ncbi:MAG: tRNA-uridine aminocarboxypropyltransferase [Aeromonadaceae bacterium]
MMSKRAYCPHCQRPLTTCLCSLARSVASPWPVVILQDPSEVHQAKGSVPLLQACLHPLTVWVSNDFSHHEGLNALLQDPGLAPLLLYPGNGARPASELKAELAGRTPCFVLLDGTWRKSLKLLHSHPALAQLPRLTLTTEPESGYHIRKSPRADGLSTFEAVTAILGEWSSEPDTYAPLTASFQAWIERELARLPPEVRSRYPG